MKNGRKNNDFGPKCKTRIVNNVFSVKTETTNNAKKCKDWNNQ